MESLEAIKKKTSGAVSLKAIVKTMKILAAVSMRQYEKMLDALQFYVDNVEMGLQVVLKDFETLHDLKETRTDVKTGAIIFGSDMGMCGQFNELAALHAGKELSAYKKSGLEIISIGDRIGGKLEDKGFGPGETILYPAGLSGNVMPVLQELLVKIEKWRDEKKVGRVMLIYNSPAKEGIRYAPLAKTLLPVDKAYLEGLKSKKWDSRTLPIYKAQRNAIFSTLIKNLLYAGLFKAFVDSLASENAARLASMQAAEKHIDEHIEEMTAMYNQARQDQITSEILDIIAGFEAVTN